MPNFLVGSAYAVSAGLIVYAITAKIVTDDFRAPLVLAWAAPGSCLPSSVCCGEKSDCSRPTSPQLDRGALPREGHVSRDLRTSGSPSPGSLRSRP